MHLEDVREIKNKATADDKAEFWAGELNHTVGGEMGIWCELQGALIEHLPSGGLWIFWVRLELFSNNLVYFPSVILYLIFEVGVFLSVAWSWHSYPQSWQGSAAVRGQLEMTDTQKVFLFCEGKWDYSRDDVCQLSYISRNWLWLEHISLKRLYVRRKIVHI